MKNEIEHYYWDNAISELQRSFEGSEEYLKGVNDFKEELGRKMLLPSRFQLGDKVKVTIGGNIIIGCEIIKVYFMSFKVMYDLSIYVDSYDEEPYYTRLYNIDSAFVEPID